MTYLQSGRFTACVRQWCVIQLAWLEAATRNADGLLGLYSNSKLQQRRYNLVSGLSGRRHG
jgi:hypothetical protein